MKGEVKQWFIEVSRVAQVHNFKHQDAIFYKGFKLSDDRKGSFELYDVRKSDDYTRVKPKDLKKIRSMGFILAVDEISYRLTIERFKTYRKKAELLYAKKKRANKDMKKDVRLNKKRIRNADKNIDVLVDQILLCQSRINQHESKYKLN